MQPLTIWGQGRLHAVDEAGSLGRCLTVGGKNISGRCDNVLRKQRGGMIWLSRSSRISKEPQMCLEHEL